MKKLFWIALAVVVVVIIINVSTKHSTSHVYQPSFSASTNGSGSSASANGNGGSQSQGSGNVNSTQRFSCSSGTFADNEIPWNSQALKIVTEGGDVIYIQNEYGPTDTVNWSFDGNAWIKLSAVGTGTSRDNVYIGKGSKQVMKLDGATGNFNPDTEFYNYAKVCTSWSVQTVNAG